MEKGDVISLVIGVVLIVVYFVNILPGLGFALTSPPIVAVYWVVVAVFIAPPAAKFLSEKAVGSALTKKGGKVRKEYSRARSLAAQGRFEEAIEEFRRGLEKEADNIMLRLEIAEIYSREIKDYRQAVVELEECLKFKLGPTQGASILNRIADVYEADLDDGTAAREALRRILEFWPATKVADRAKERLGAMEKEVGSPE